MLTVATIFASSLLIATPAVGDDPGASRQLVSYGLVKGDFDFIVQSLGLDAELVPIARAAFDDYLAEVREIADRGRAAILRAGQDHVEAASRAYDEALAEKPHITRADLAWEAGLREQYQAVLREHDADIKAAYAECQREALVPLQMFVSVLESLNPQPRWSGDTPERIIRRRMLLHRVSAHRAEFSIPDVSLLVDEARAEEFSRVDFEQGDIPAAMDAMLRVYLTQVDALLKQQMARFFAEEPIETDSDVDRDRRTDAQEWRALWAVTHTATTGIHATLVASGHVDEAEQFELRFRRQLCRLLYGQDWIDVAMEWHSEAEPRLSPAERISIASALKELARARDAARARAFDIGILLMSRYPDAENERAEYRRAALALRDQNLAAWSAFATTFGGVAAFVDLRARILDPQTKQLKPELFGQWIPEYRE